MNLKLKAAGHCSLQQTLLKQQKRLYLLGIIFRCGLIRISCSMEQQDSTEQIGLNQNEPQLVLDFVVTTENVTHPSVFVPQRNSLTGRHKIYQDPLDPT